MSLLAVTWRRRLEGRLDRGWDLPDPDLRALVARAPEGRLTLGGGEPTLRADLPQLIAALGPRDLGMVTDGLALSRGLGPLPEAGLGRVRIELHSARPAAHDWLMGSPGVFKRAVAAFRVVSRSGLALEAETVLTRPTRPHVAETVELVARLGARALVLRRLEARGPAKAQLAALAPDLELLTPDLERAHAVARRLGLQLRIEGIPRCLLGGARAAWAPREPLNAPDHWTHGPGCDGCDCDGLDVATARVQGRQAVDRSPPAPELDLVGPSRGLRQALARMEPGPTLRVRVELDRPEAPELLRDCGRLGFERVLVSAHGDLRPWSPSQLRQLRQLTEIVLDAPEPRLAQEAPRLQVVLR